MAYVLEFTSTLPPFEDSGVAVFVPEALEKFL